MRGLIIVLAVLVLVVAGACGHPAGGNGACLGTFPDGAAAGSACRSPSQCCSGVCTANGFLATDGSACSFAPIGGSCTGDNDCITAICTGGVCQCLPAGRLCVDPSDCCSSNCAPLEGGTFKACQ